MEQLQKLQYLSLVSKITTELEHHLGLADKTLSEFIIELSKGKNSVKEFRLELRENGADMPDALVETLWAIILRMMPGRGGGSSSGGGAGPSGLQPRAGAAFGGLALPDTRDRVKEMEEEMLAEARAKAEQSAAAERQRGHGQASSREAGPLAPPPAGAACCAILRLPARHPPAATAAAAVRRERFRCAPPRLLAPFCEHVRLLEQLPLLHHCPAAAATPPAAVAAGL